MFTHGKRKAILTEVSLKIWVSLLLCSSRPPSLGLTTLTVILTTHNEARIKFFFENKDAFHETMNIYFSWEGSHSPFSVCSQPAEPSLISESQFPFTWTLLKTLPSWVFLLLTDSYMITKNPSPVRRRKKRIAGKRKKKSTICTARTGQLQGKGCLL